MLRNIARVPLNRRVQNTRFRTRSLVIFRKNKGKIHENDNGIEATNSTKNNPDSEFMKLWKSTENNYKDRLRETVNPGKRLLTRKQNKDVTITTLPRKNEVTQDRANVPKLMDDSDNVGFRVPKFGEIVRSLVLGKKEKVVNTSSEEMETQEPQSYISHVSFGDVGVHPKLVQRLKTLGITKPVSIQEKALPRLYNNASVLIKSETGSGKTLVFLLPTVQDPGKSYGTVIVVPTRELASQMAYEVHRLLGDKSIVASFVSGVDLASQEKRLKDTSKPPRIVIGTPKRLLEIVEANESLFSKTKRIIVDEVDKVLLPLHKRASQKKVYARAVHPRAGHMLVEKIAKASKVQVPRKQFIGASATVDDGLLEDLVDMGWGDHVTVIQSSSYEGKTRSIPSCIEHRYTVYDEHKETSKAMVLARVYGNSNQMSALVFIHRNLSVDDFVWELGYLGLNAVALYKKVATQDPSKHKQFLTDFQSGKFQLVVGTEETVRGLDFKELQHVYLMEVPKNVEEYLHLAGRVGRQGRAGTVTTIVSTTPVGEERRMLLQYRRLGVPYECI